METVSAINFHDFTSSITGKASKVNQNRKVPVILAKELIQEYSKWELTDFLRKQIPEGVDFVKVLKPYSALKDAIKGMKKLPITFGHIGMVTDEKDWRIEGWVRQLKFDDINKTIKGWAYISTLHLTDAQLFLLDNGEPIDVSIGGTAIFGDGCNHCFPSYMFTQDKIMLNHLAILWEDKGRCGIEHCGLNMDSSEGSENLETRIHVCGFNDEVKQPIFTLKRDILNTPADLIEDNTLKGDTNMTIEELKTLMEKQKSDFGDQTGILIKSNEKLTIERDAAIGDAKSKCDANKELMDENSDLKAIIKTYEDTERKSYVEYFGDKKLLDEEQVMKMDVVDLKEKKELVESVISKINDGKIKDKGLPKPGINSRAKIGDKKKINASSIARDKDEKKDEGDK